MQKYRNKKTEYNGMIFDSKKEANYCQQLDLCKKASNLCDRVIGYKRQVPFEIKIKGKKICKYYADFVVVFADKKKEVVDVKGFKTPVYKLKKKMVEAEYGIKILEY